MTLASRDVQKNCSRMRVWTFNGTSATEGRCYQYSMWGGVSVEGETVHTAITPFEEQGKTLTKGYSLSWPRSSMAIPHRVSVALCGAASQVSAAH
jgi:hypothetical protein